MTIQPSPGSDKDRVLIRSEGDSTYYLADIAYHRQKLERSGGRLLDVLGADHHGYMQRLRAGLAALALDPERLEFSIMQLVHVVEGGERVQMSKRKGEFVTLDELVEDIGVDATRFFMLQRSHDTTVDLDLELARKTSNENPVYYVQYAHARIASILSKAGEGAEARAESADLDAVEGPVALTECASAASHCSIESTCLVGHGWQRISRAIRRALVEVSLEELVRRDAAFAAPDLLRPAPPSRAPARG